MELLKRKDVILINHLTISDVGGNFVPPDNLLHNSALDYVVEAAAATVFGQALYPTLAEKAGLYMHSIITNHVFQDGNKRTGLESALLFLQLNHCVLQPTPDEEIITFTLAVAGGKLSLEEVQRWFSVRLQKL